MHVIRGVVSKRMVWWQHNGGCVPSRELTTPCCSGTLLLLHAHTTVTLYGTLHLRERAGGKESLDDRNKVPFAQLAPESVKLQLKTTNYHNYRSNHRVVDRVASNQLIMIK